MRSAVYVGVVALLAVPALADPTMYTFEVTTGEFTIDVAPQGLVTPDPVTFPVGGTFMVAIWDNGDGVGASDTFMLGSANIHNVEEEVLTLWGGVGTATFPPTSATIVEFAPESPGHIGAGGIGTIDTNVHARATVSVTGAWRPGVWSQDTWGLDVETFEVDFTIENGVPTGVALGGSFNYNYMFDTEPFGDFGHEVQIQGTIVPDPALVGLTALGVGGGGAWLRRRRR